MFGIDWQELLVIVFVAVVVIGPKDLPRAMRTAGKWIGKVRRTSNHFRAGIETMIREAELEEMEKEWREQNARIMAETGSLQLSEDEKGTLSGESAQMEPLAHPVSDDVAPTAPEDEPPLPFSPPERKG